MSDASTAHEDHPSGWRRFVYSTNHKDIGTMYLVFAVVGLVLVADDSPNPGGPPKGRRAAVEITNRHLGYAFTWYGLAAALAVIYFIYHIKREERSGDST